MINPFARKSAAALALTVALVAGFFAPGLSGVSAQEEPAFVAGDAVSVFDGALNLRAAPGLDADVVEVLADGTALTVLGGPESVDSISWYQVETADGTQGWVTGEFIQPLAPSGEFAAGDTVVVATGPLNMRETAGTDASILETLDEGTTAAIADGPVTASGFVWYAIELADGETGWVAVDFLAAVGDATPDFAVGDAIVVADGPLNLRGGASLGATVLETLDEGATGTIVSGPSTTVDEIAWYQIEVTGGENGWVAGEFLALAGSEPTPSADEFPIDSWVFVNAPTLNLRADASIDAEILDSINEGNIMTILDGPVAGGDYDWYQVVVGEGDAAQEGWVAGSLLSGGIRLGQPAVVVDGPLNLRAEASPSAEALAQLETGDTVAVVAGPVTGGGFVWFEVEVGEETGFVAGRFLGPVQTEAPAE
jgi:N-acetylmuramoyl-L-alanine amidase